jgi:hypothetical protein
VIIDRPDTSLSISWNAPSSLGVGSPAAISLSITGADVRQVDLYVQPPVGSSRWVGVATASTDNSWVVTWPGPTRVGQHVLSATLTTAAGTRSGGAWVVTAE